MHRYHYTTDLATIRTWGSAFTWGMVLTIHDIGRYTIVKYAPRDMGVGKDRTHINPDREPEYHIYVDGKDTSQGAKTLESALVCAIAHATVAPHTPMASAACKLLNLT